MSKFDPKLDAPIDVLVLGEHPSAYLAAAALRADARRASRKAKPKLRVVHATLPAGQSADRLVTVNPALFALHPLLAGVGRSVPTTAVHGVRFLADDAGTAGEHRAATAMVCVARYRDLRDASAAAAAAEGVEFIGGGGGTDPPVQVHRVDEAGLDATVGRHRRAGHGPGAGDRADARPARRPGAPRRVGTGRGPPRDHAPVQVGQAAGAAARAGACRCRSTWAGG